MNTLRILIIEDDADAAEGLAGLAREVGFDEAEIAESPSMAKQKWKGEIFDAITLDLHMENDSQAGFRLLQELRSGSQSPRRVFIYSAHLHNLLLPCQAVQTDTVSFHSKPDERSLLVEAMASFVQGQRTRLRSKIYSSSPNWKDLMQTVEHLAKSELPVLLLGPTGGGKTTFAKHLAQESGCPSDRTLVINCASLGENLVESELFGYHKGAFTGALKDTLGSLLVASGFKSLSGDGGKLNKQLGGYKSTEHKWGAVILDEIAALPVHLQAKLLTVLDGAPMRPLGHTGPGFIPNFRVFAATNEVEKFSNPALFRKDLRHRLQGWIIQVPDASVQTDVVAQILENEGVFFRNEQGERDKMKTEWEIEAKDYLLSEDCLSKVEGGFREVKNIIGRAALYASIEDGKKEGRRKITKAMVEKALNQNLQFIAGSAIGTTTSVNADLEAQADSKIADWLKENNVTAKKHNYKALLDVMPADKCEAFVNFTSTEFTGRGIDDSGFLTVMSKGLKNKKQVPVNTIRKAFRKKAKNGNGHGN
jgi:DNA-binding NtrC family response regulator